MQAPSGDHVLMHEVVTSRRRFLVTTAGVATCVTMPMPALAAESKRDFLNSNQMKESDL